MMTTTRACTCTAKREWSGVGVPGAFSLEETEKIGLI